MADDLPDRQVIKESLAWRAKYRTKEQNPLQNLRCGEIVPHPSNRGEEATSTFEATGNITAQRLQERVDVLGAKFKVSVVTGPFRILQGR